MKFISIQEALDKKEGKVSLRGWVYRERKQKEMAFIVMRDSSNIIQCVVKEDKVSKKEWEDANKILIESSLEIEGTLKEDKRAPTGYELQVSKLNVIHFAEKFPISKDHSPEFLLDVRHLSERSRTSRHLTEYWHAEVETAWQHFPELLDLAEGLIKYIVKTVLKENKKELDILGRDTKKLEPIVKEKFPNISNSFLFSFST